MDSPLGVSLAGRLKMIRSRRRTHRPDLFLPSEPASVRLRYALDDGPAREHQLPSIQTVQRHHVRELEIWLGRMVPAAMVAATRRTSAQFLSIRSVLPAPAREPLDCQP